MWDNDNLNNISDEMLAAFLDGNATVEENRLIENSMFDNENLMEIVDITNDVISFGGRFDIWKGDYGFWELGIDPVFTREELLEEDFDINNNKIINDAFIVNSLETESIDNVEIHEAGYMKVYGEERTYELNPFNKDIWQEYKNTCAIRAQEIILRDYGIMIPQEQLMEFAAQNNWYDPGKDLSDSTFLDGGTPIDCVGNLLNSCGIETRLETNCNIFDLVKELSQGHRVIVSVDAYELWEKGWFAEQKHKFEDMYQQGGNHALIVAGVEVNPENPSDIHVVLTDPGTGELRVTYEWDKFYGAWEDSKCTMISTTIPAPYQYNAATGLVEPSGFASQFFPSPALAYSGIINIFPPLPASYYSTFQDNSPYYLGIKSQFSGELIQKYTDSSNSDIDEVEHNTEICEESGLIEDSELSSGEDSIYEEESDSENSDNDTDHLIESDNMDLLT